MDALALLCNLHADGPLTLQRLRRLGCESIGTVLTLDAAVLGAELDQASTSAERFQREARFLLERLEGSARVVAPKPGAAPGPAPAAVERAPLPGFAAPEVPAQVEVTTGVIEAGNQGIADRVGCARSAGRSPELSGVLDAWRDLDRDDPPSTPTVYEAPEATLLADVELEDVELDGLTPHRVEQLAALGVLSLRGLVEADAMELAEDLELGVTRILRLQFLARRALTEVLEQEGPAEPSHAPSAHADLRPAVRPAVRAFQAQSAERPDALTEDEASMSVQETRALWGVRTAAPPAHEFPEKEDLQAAFAPRPEHPPEALDDERTSGAELPQPNAMADAAHALAEAPELGVDFLPKPPDSLPTIQEILARRPQPPLSTREPAQERAAANPPAEEEAGSSGPFA